MGLRTGPARLVAAVRRRRAPGAAGASQRSARPAAITVLAEAPGEEFVLGIMGRLWTTTGGLVKASAAQLRHPPPAGLAQGFWTFRVEPCGAGTTLSTETRVRCGDAPPDAASCDTGASSDWGAISSGAACCGTYDSRQSDGPSPESAASARMATPPVSNRRHAILGRLHHEGRPSCL